MQINSDTHGKRIPIAQQKFIEVKPNQLKPIQGKSTMSFPNCSNKFLNKLIHKLGHDLRSPIFVAKSYSQLLLKAKEANRLDRGLRMIAESTVKMEGLVNSLVGLIDIYTLPVPTYELLLLEDAFKKAKLKLSSDLDKHSPAIHTNFKSYPIVKFAKSFLIEIFYEIISNAIKHNIDHPNLHIYINSFKKNDKLVLEIKDNGTGILDLGDKYFDPFYSCSENENFTGVGLSKVQAIAKVTNGVVSLENQPSGGLTCRYYF